MTPIEILHGAIDEQVAKKFPVDSYPCHEGCNWCCYLRVDCCPEEGEAINEYIQTLPRPLRKRIKKQEARWFKVHGEDIDFEGELAKLERGEATPEELEGKAEVECERHVARARSRNAPCPYLVDGSCAVYKVRPVTCRDAFPSPGFGVKECEDQSAPISSFDFTQIARGCVQLEINYLDQARVPNQVCRARGGEHE